MPKSKSQPAQQASPVQRQSSLSSKPNDVKEMGLESNPYKKTNQVTGKSAAIFSSLEPKAFIYLGFWNYWSRRAWCRERTSQHWDYQSRSSITKGEPLCDFKNHSTDGEVSSAYDGTREIHHPLYSHKFQQRSCMPAKKLHSRIGIGESKQADQETWDPLRAPRCQKQ